MTATGLSFKFYDGDAAQDTFAISIDYIAEAHLKVYEVESGIPVLKTVVTHYNITGGNVVFTGGNIPSAGTDNVRIIRVTPRELANRQIDWSALSMITDTDMDLDQKQLILTLQEALETDDSGDVNPNAEYIRWDTVRALWLAQHAAADAKMGGLLDPTSNDEAATKKYVDDISSWATAGVPQAFTFNGTGSQDSFTLTGAPNAEAEMLVVAISGVVQRPGGSFDYTVLKGATNSTLVFASAPASGTDNILVLNLGKARFLNNAIIADGSITTAKYQDASITSAKIGTGEVSEDNIASAAVGTAELVNEGVTLDKIAADAVNLEKMKSAAFTAVPGGSYDQPLMVDKDDGNLVQRVMVPGDINGFDAQVQLSRLDQMASPTANIHMNSKKITNLVDPTANQEAATKKYVDDSVASGDSKIVKVKEVTLGADATTIDLGVAWVNAAYHYYTMTVTQVNMVGTINLDFNQSGIKTVTFLGPMPLGSATQPGIWEMTLQNIAAAQSVKPFVNAKMPGVSVTQTAPTAAGVTDIQWRTITANGFKAGMKVIIYGHKS